MIRLPALLTAAAIALSACQVAQMQVAPALSGLSAVPVAGANPRRWNSQVSFGPWRTELVREGMRWDFALSLLGLKASYSFQPYRVVVSAGGEPLQAECITRAASLARRDLEVDPAFGNIPTLACGFRGRGDGTLRLRTTAVNREEGTIDFGDTSWTLQSVHRFHGSSIPSGPPLGYEIMGAGQVLAAVETINQGRVWLNPAVSPRDQERLAAAIMVLLLFQPAAGD
jgi:hypothetical protein